MNAASRRAVFLLALLLAGGLALPGQGNDGKPAPQPFLYRDDQDGRALAEVRIALVGSGAQRSLRLTISATGSLVEPIAGWRGIRGANRHTAEQFAFLLSGFQPVAVLTRNASVSLPWFGTLKAGQRGPVPERRLGPDGRLLFSSATDQHYPLELIVDAGRVRPGLQQTDIIVDGVPRLRVSYQLAGDALQLLSFASLGDPRHQKGGKAPELLTVLPQEPGGKEEKKDPPLPAPVGDADWDGRDLEGKWGLYRRSLVGKEKPYRAWLQYLAKRQDFAFLESLALYGDASDERLPAALALAKLNAPQWVRVAVWHRDASAAEHVEPQARNLLIKHNPAFVWSWLEKHKAQAIRRDSPVEADYDTLREKKLAIVDVSKALPPLKDEDVFRHLDAPNELADLGARTRGEPGKVYVQQVLRAIQGVVVSAQYREPWFGKVRRLTRHALPQVRQAAYLAFTHFAPRVPGKDTPLDEFAAVADDAREPALVREAALMAYSYFRHPKVYMKLHHLALDLDHPAWRTAISRLYDVGDGFTLRHLDRLEKVKLLPEDRELVRQTQARLQRYIKEFREDSVSYYVEGWLERAAWAGLTKDPLAAPLASWAKEFFTMRGGATVVAVLEKLVRDYRPDFPVPLGEDALIRGVQTLARDVLAARMKKR